MTDPLFMLKSEHTRILAAAQARHDAEFDNAYTRGRWDGLAMGLVLGTGCGFVFAVTLYLLMVPQ